MHLECPACRHRFDRQVQKGVDVGIATLILKLAAQGVYDRLILSAGDGDFEDAISYVKSELHKEVWMNGAQATLSTDLQSYANRVLWLDDMVPAIDKPNAIGQVQMSAAAMTKMVPGMLNGWRTE